MRLWIIQDQEVAGSGCGDICMVVVVVVVVIRGARRKRRKKRLATLL